MMAIIITQLTKTLTPTITLVAMFLPVKLPVSSTRITGMERNEFVYALPTLYF